MSNMQKTSFCGFQPYSYRNFTKQLRQLLQDRYTWDGDGFTILKELIQNANDAGATSLHLGWSPPLSGAPSASIATGHLSASSSSQAPHPLLTVTAEHSPKGFANGRLESAFGYWFILKNDEPVICLDTDSRLYKLGGEVHDLMASYGRHKRVWPVIVETALELLP